MNAPACDSKKPKADPETEGEGGGGTLQTGTRTCTIPPACTADGGTSCVANATYTAALTTGLSSKVVSGNTVAGVAGNVTIPSVGNVLTTITYGASGTSSVGTLTLPSAANVRTSQGTFGVGGTATTPTLVDCATDGGTSCVTVAGYPAAKLANFSASNIQGGVTIAAIAGSGFTTATCGSDGQQNCAVSGVFKAANVTGISTWDLRSGLSLGGITGALKTNCRNTVNNTYFNYDGAVGSLPNTGITSGTASDYWDTMDDRFGWSTNTVTGWSSNTYCDSTTWTDVTTTNGGTSNVACGTSACIYKDQITNLQVTGILASGSNTTDTTTPATYTWSAAVNACAGSTYGGFTAGTWRLPTQKELMSLYEHGIAAMVGTNFMSLANMTNYFWSSSTTSTSTTNAWRVYLAAGHTDYGPKTFTYSVSCVK